MPEKWKVDGHTEERGHYLNFMHFNRKNGSVVLPFFKAMIFRLRFLTPLVSPIIPRKATELLLSCVELIAFIDLMGPPRHFSKIVIENAA